MSKIYLDFNASTPLDPSVRSAMEPYLDSAFGNPSSLHWAGRPAREAVERARSQVAAFLGCDTDEVIFTSGGSEASNLAIKGVFFRWVLGGFAEDEELPHASDHEGRANRPHFVTTAIEHPATLNPLRFLEALGAVVTVLPVDRSGRVDPADVSRAITPETILVSVMHANNEVGTIQPIEEISTITSARGVLLHVDAAQSAGKIPLDVNCLGVDLLTLAAHKFYGPKGVGALYVRHGVRLEPLVHGAGHESGRRAGTENVPLIVGLGQACAVASALPEVPAIRELRDFFERELLARFGAAVTVNGHPQHRLPNTLNVNFVGRIGADVLSGLDEVAASTGSACHAGSVELSPVLRAMQVPPEEGMGAVRFSLGRGTSRAEIDSVLDRLGESLT